ncbi:MAG: hypothetical protein A2W90_14525 [Bacteroidetes bacterium GWF2_42_66]|nr:MAG: hypothetical protein A2W92_15920 [Bacteroidetes bacterium GWA2_42_15]OFX99089.1 MAG: hypothetical protein A2W89_06735 [Bacteroidetes bacterium GWE2_42_39]OFY46742.1 MAG: hypothetical protein A2W90_14525 [Bacteroidetes bacterium GWF2_42_66]HAZ00689.1 hypothetical protein [Marinilabiliales bacterium]HBL73852.1 hypothetical protein [Prolixibacteraceae bacterium]
MQVTISKSTAKALKKSMGFTFAAVTKKPEHREFDNETLQILGITREQCFGMARLIDQINIKLKNK